MIFKWSLFKRPIDLSKLNCERIKFLSESALVINALSNKELDCITSKVVLPTPLSYSAVIPSLAISAALTWASTEDNKLWLDKKFDHALATTASLVLTALSRRSLFRVFKFLFLFKFALFYPPE